MKIKSENRKALPKFLVIMAACCLLGAIVGYLSVSSSDTDIAAQITVFLGNGLALISPYAIWLCALIPLVLTAVNLRKVRREFTGWQEEDTETMKVMDQQLTAPMVATAICTIFAYFFFAALFCSLPRLEVFEFLIGLIGFVFYLIVMTLCQQKLVDMNKKMNPEKRGSVYDLKFNKTYLASCDEAEKARIYEAGYTAYKTAVTTCLFTWLILIFCHMFFDTGFFPIAVVSLIWLAATVSYLWKAARLEKGKK